MAYLYKLRIEAYNDFSEDIIKDECYFDGKAFCKDLNAPEFQEVPATASNAIGKKVLEWSTYYDHVTAYLIEVNAKNSTEEKQIAEYFNY